LWAFVAFDADCVFASDFLVHHGIDRFDLLNYFYSRQLWHFVVNDDDGKKVVICSCFVKIFGAAFDKSLAVVDKLAVLGQAKLVEHDP